MNSSRVYLEQFIERSARSLDGDALVLDAGAGDCRYAKHFSHVRYESADFCRVEKAYAPVDYVCDLRSIPVEDGRFDMVLLTQVLEHLPDPSAVLTELQRVLKPGGTLWLTAPLFYEEHEKPYDFYRYTQFGCTHLLEDSGFRVNELDWLEGYCGTLAYQLAVASRSLPSRSSDYGGGATGLAVALSLRIVRRFLGRLSGMFARLDIRHRYTGGGHCKNYWVVAERV